MHRVVDSGYSCFCTVNVREAPHSLCEIEKNRQTSSLKAACHISIARADVLGCSRGELCEIPSFFFRFYFLYPPADG